MGREEVEGHWEGKFLAGKGKRAKTGQEGMPDEITVPILFSWKCRPLLSNSRVKLSPSGWHPGELLGWPGQWPLSSVSGGTWAWVSRPALPAAALAPWVLGGWGSAELFFIGKRTSKSWDWPQWDRDRARTRFCLSNLIDVNPDYNSDISFPLSGFASSTPNLALWVSMQFMINFNEFKTNPLQQYITYLFLLIYVLFPEGENGRKSPKSQKTRKKRKKTEEEWGRGRNMYYALALI